MPSPAIYTTANEQRFLRELARRGKHDLLRRLLPAYQRRDWSGDGMAVDREQVLACLARLLGGRSR